MPEYQHRGIGKLMFEHAINFIKTTSQEAKRIELNVNRHNSAKAFFAGQNPPYDCYVAMYHDQGLIPMKLIGGRQAVNVTIGLDVLRTSPSHGTAFDIAGQNIADEASMIEAIKLALVY